MKITLDLDALDYKQIRECAEYARVTEPHLVGCIIRLIRDFMPEANDDGVVPFLRPAFAELRMAGREGCPPVIPALVRAGVVRITDRGFVQFTGVKTDDTQQGRCRARA